MTVFAAGVSATWMLTRAYGAVSLLLLTAAFALGVADVARWRSRTWPRFAIDALHRNIALLALAFVVVHVLTTVLDRFVSIGLAAAVVPFSNGYRGGFWLGLGAVAFDLFVALIATSMLRRRIGLRVWRAVHWAAYACWPVALLHAVGTGTDASQPWMLGLALGCTAAIGAAVIARLTLGGAGGREPDPPSRRGAGEPQRPARRPARARQGMLTR
ncbi:MAG TPA: ferric reductase-like transmembrane domain-containing protein [Conexibacter sp.]|nr:ferric reductase-like transmembrane domain-containing protein [Conexibacter sp.]